MSTCPFASNVAVAANRTLIIVGLGGGGPAGAGGGWVAHEARIVAVTAETRIIAMALFSPFIALRCRAFHLSPRSVVALIRAGLSAVKIRVGSRVGAGGRDATAEGG